MFCGYKLRVMDSLAPASFVLKALHLSTRLALKQVATYIPISAANSSGSELEYQLGERSFVFIYNFGAIAFFNVAEEEQQTYIKAISNVSPVNPQVTSEDFKIVEVNEADPVSQKHDLTFDSIRIRELTLKKIKLVADIIAESTAIEYFEQIVERDLLTESRSISRSLRSSGKTSLSMKDMARFVGTCLATKQDIISELYVVDSPEETWEDQNFAKLYFDLKQHFEIETRYRVLEYKLKLIQETVDVIVEMLRFKRHQFLEVVIVALIAVEVVWPLLRMMVSGLPQLGF